MGVKESFIDKYGLDALLVEMATGFPADLLLAQAALETGWGQYVAGNNLFGIKDVPWDPGSIETNTTEFVGNVATNTIASFEDFESSLHAMICYVALLRNSDRYRKAWEKAQNRDIGGFCVAIHEAGYATDPDYSQKLYLVYRSLPKDWRKRVLDKIRTKGG